MRSSVDSKLFWVGSFAVSLVLHIAAAIFSVGYHQYDEHFQILEFATIKQPFSSGMETDLPWEYQEQIRPAIQPLFVVLIGKAMHHLGNYDPFICVLILQLLSAVLGWASLMLFSKEAALWFTWGFPARTVLAAASLFWMFPYVHARYSSESWSGSLFFLALSFLLMISRKSRDDFRKCTVGFLLTGLLLGLAFIVRFQTGIMITGLFIWCIIIAKLPWKALLLLILGIGIAALAGIIIDTWFYGEIVFTPWNYFKANIIHDAASSFGISPWWSYFLWLSQNLLPPFSIIILLAFAYALMRYRSNVLTWIIVPFIIIHIIIPHKELRFVFPLINAFPALFVITYCDINRRLSVRRLFVALAIAFSIANISPLLTAVFQPINSDIVLYKYIWRHYAQAGEQIQLVYKEKNPFKDGHLFINFYKPKNLYIIEDRSGSEQHFILPEPTSNKLLLIHRTLRPDTLSVSDAHKVVYKTNNWVLFEVLTQE